MIPKIFIELIAYTLITILICIIIYKAAEQKSIFLDMVGLIQVVMWLVIGEYELASIMNKQTGGKDKDIITEMLNDDLDPALSSDPEPNIILTNYMPETTTDYIPEYQQLSIKPEDLESADLQYDASVELLGAGINSSYIPPTDRSMRTFTDGVDDAHINAGFDRYFRRIGTSHRIDDKVAANFVDQLYDKPDAWWDDF